MFYDFSKRRVAKADSVMCGFVSNWNVGNAMILLAWMVIVALYLAANDNDGRMKFLLF